MLLSADYNQKDVLSQENHAMPHRSSQRGPRKLKVE